MGRGAARGGVTDVVWVQALAVLVALRVLIPLVVLAASPKKIPLLPAYTYVPLNGDAYGSYHAVSNLFSAFSAVMIGWIGLGTLAMIACFSVAAVILWRSGVRWLAVLLPALAVSLALGYLAREMGASEAGVIGWPLVWALSLAPLSVLRIPLDHDIAFGAGLIVSVAANAVTVVALAVVGVRATGRRSVGLLAAGLFATWPLWVGIVAGHGAWANGQWDVDVGLHLYSEPLSTALVAVGVALLLRPVLTPTTAAVAGLLLGLATLTKLPNGVIAVGIVILVLVAHGLRRALVLAVGGLVSLPILIGFWPHGYVDASSGKGIDAGVLYRWSYVVDNIHDSPVFTGPMLLLLLPLAALGVIAVRGWFARSLLVWTIVGTVLSFAGYYVTAQHPRFFYVALPELFVLQSAGVVLIVDHLRRQVRPAPVPET
jgi:hypothetical protein